VDLLRAYLEPRAAYVDDWIACDRGVGGTDADGDGVAWCIECDDANDAVFPGAPEVCNGFDDDCDSAIDRTDACCTDVEIRGVHYGICNWPRTWDDASAFCASIGATLGAPPDADANTDLFWAALGYSWEDFWIGVTDATVEGTFTDPAGAPLAWEGWAAGTPDGADAEDCAVLDVWLGGAWNDRSCGEVHPSICRMP